ncbi:MAG: hypothetical protein ACKVJX_08495 [Verrucomicrobiia bacterium]
MEFQDFIQLGEQEPRLRFLLIGGWAVAAHGHTRPTHDVDFMVSRADRETWTQRVEDAGLTRFAAQDQFAQYTQPDGDGFDLMFVSPETFEKMWPASVDADFNGVSARVPCLDHLIALKLHALKQALPHRTSKDMEDVELMIQRNEVNLRSERYEELFLKHGTREIYDTFLRLC